jgi:hypothetical protein
MKELFEKGRIKSKEMFRREKESTCEIIKNGLLQPAIAWRPTERPLGTIRGQSVLLH